MSDKVRTKILIAKGLFSAFQGQYNYNTPKLHKIKIKTLRVNIFIHVALIMYLRINFSNWASVYESVW